MVASFPDIDMPITVKAAFGADPTTDPAGWTFTDLSSRLLDNDIQRKEGRPVGAKTLGTKTCTIVLDNDDGELTPLFALSSKYPDVVLDLPFLIKINPTGVDTTWFEGFAASFTPDIITSTSGSTAVMRITLAGFLRHEGRGDKPVRSTLYTTIAGVSEGDYVPDWYWPCEDGPDATSIASGLPGGAPITNLSGVTFAADDSLPGSNALPTLATGAVVKATIPTYTGTGQVVWEFVMSVPSEPAATTTLWEMRMTGTATIWRVILVPGSSSQVRLNVLDSAGATLLDVGFDVVVYLNLTTEADFYGHHVMYAVCAEQSGSDIIGTFEAHAVSGSYGSDQNTIASTTLGIVTELTVTAAVGINGATFGHHAIFTDTAFVIGTDGTFNALAMDGFEGERAEDRVERMWREAGLPASQLQVSSSGRSARMGPQLKDTWLANIRDVETTDGGILSEYRYGLAYTALAAMYNQDPALTVDLAIYKTTQGTQRQVLTPTFDDQAYRNQWTVSRPSGSSYTTPDPDGQTYQDSDDLNLETDDQLEQHGLWRKNRDSLVTYRYPGSTLDLMANTSLIDDWLTASVGTRLGLARMVRQNPPSQHPSDDIDEILTYWEETLGRRKWTVTPGLVPAAPYLNIGVYGPDAAVSRYQAGYSTLAVGVDDNDTSWSVATSFGPLWTTAAGTILIAVGGLVYSCTARSGASSPQTFTVTRLATDKAHSAGAEVRVYQAARYAL